MHPNQATSTGPRIAESDALACGPLRLDLAAFRLRSGQRSVPLTYSEARLLEALFRTPDLIVSRELLAPLLLSGSNNEHALTAAMSRVRRVLRSLGYDRYLRSIRGQGYVLHEPSGSSLGNGAGREHPRKGRPCSM